MTEVSKKIWDTLNKWTIPAILGLIGLYVSVKIELANITDNKEDITNMIKIHEGDKKSLHNRLTRYKAMLDAALLDIKELKTTLKFLEKEHP
jgi:hypothetical protein